jgi:hypothetical protein
MARDAEEKLAVVGGCGFCRDVVAAARERLSDERIGREKRWNFDENSLADLRRRQGVYMYEKDSRIPAPSIDKL